MNKSAASAASPDYVKFQAVIKSAASAASLRGGRASGRLDHGYLFAIFGRASNQKIVKIPDPEFVIPDYSWPISGLFARSCDAVGTGSPSVAHGQQAAMHLTSF